MAEDTKPIVKSEPKDVKLESETKEEPPKAKPSGKLDFSKAKTTPKPAPQTRKVESTESSTASKAAAAPKPEPKRASRSKNKVCKHFFFFLRLPSTRFFLHLSFLARR